jgi:hypothetical protein
MGLKKILPVMILAAIGLAAAKTSAQTVPVKTTGPTPPSSQTLVWHATTDGGQPSLGSIPPETVTPLFQARAFACPANQECRFRLAADSGRHPRRGNSGVRFGCGGSPVSTRQGVFFRKSRIPGSVRSSFQRRIVFSTLRMNPIP